MKHLVNNRICRFLFVLAFLAKILLPYVSVQAHVLPIGYSNLQTKNLDKKVLICTTEGYQWVSLSELLSKTNKAITDTNLSDLSDSQYKHHHCLCCFSANDADENSVKPYYVVLHPTEPIDDFLHSTIILLPTYLLLSLRARAPPIV